MINKYKNDLINYKYFNIWIKILQEFELNIKNLKFKLDKNKFK